MLVWLPFTVSIMTAIALTSGNIYCIGWSFTFSLKPRGNLLMCFITFALVSLLIVGYFVEALQMGEIRRSMWMYCQGVSHRH
ncbi:hypothetical protein F5148DRAFT_1216586 [Russula earlei]|uniref:Uncharacterized protein n=1 Tax=Russula earlei TaxID=71964 RepID=A0ACC0U360_9AGAM|nr:hypothetical protein F5148DRAFT_1216586 [Russula earlei]